MSTHVRSSIYSCSYYFITSLTTEGSSEAQHLYSSLLNIQKKDKSSEQTTGNKYHWIAVHVQLKLF